MRTIRPGEYEMGVAAVTVTLRKVESRLVRRLNPDQRVECRLVLLVLRDGALQLGRDLLTLAGVDDAANLA